MVQCKYKLVKPYPNRGIGAIAIYDPEINMNNFVWENDKKIIPVEFQPDVTPDWFEEIPVRNYNIVSECVQTTSKIEEVKRFSDGLVFKVGDETNNGVIERFRENGTHMRVHFVGKGTNYHVSINAIRKTEKPLFRTDDGVDIFDGDIFYYLTHDYVNNKEERDSYGTMIARKESPNGEMAYKRFGKEENVKEHIFMDAEVFSLRDIASVYSTANHRNSNRNNGYDGWSKQAFQLRTMLTKKLKNE